MLEMNQRPTQGMDSWELVIMAYMSCFCFSSAVLFSWLESGLEERQ